MLILLALSMGVGSAVSGDWQTPGGAVIRAYACGEAACLKVVRMSPNPPSTVDGHNPDKALQTRPICGLEIGTGFKAEDETHLSGGRIYDPVSGKTYKGSMTLEGDELKLRGYIGISMLGRTENWKRVATIEACK